MKFSAIFIFVALLQVSAAGYSQGITLSKKNAALEKVFNEISKQTGYKFLYGSKMLRLSPKVDIEVSNGSIEQVLQLCFRDQPLVYTIVDKVVIVKPKPVVPMEIDSVGVPPPIDIQGRILDENGEPLAGVTVSVKGTRTGTSTDDGGRFNLRNISEDAMLVISMLGYESQELPVNSSTDISVTLKRKSSELENIVVVGFGTQKKLNLTGAVTQVKGDEIVNRMSPSVLTTLQGIIPNLNTTITNRGGEPGANPSFNIRGPGSLSGGSPFVLVDGIPQDMNSVNPNDIESISVLKDASASAIYGARAAYGVILITTKKGSLGSAPKISYNANAAWQAPTTLPDVVSSVEWATTVNEGFANSGEAPYYSDELIGKMKQYIKDPTSLPSTEPNPSSPNTWGPPYANVNYYDVFFKPYAFNHNHNISVSGGGDAVAYFISGGLYNQGSQYRYGDEKYHRYSLTANISSQVTKWMNIGLNTKFTKRKIEMPHVYPAIGDYYHDIPRRWPVNPIYDANGNTYTNTLTLMKDGGRNKTDENQLLNSFLVEIEPIKNWKINGDVNFRQNFNGNTDHAKTVYRYFVDNTPYADGYSVPNYYANYSYKGYFNSNNIYTSYQHNLNRHFFKVMAGVQSELSRDESVSVKRNQLITDNVPFVTTATGISETDGSKSNWATLGVFGRLNYNFDEKLLFEFSSRYDGTSRFQKGRRWGFFPSVSVGYNIARESFWNTLSDRISMLKIRASYGSLGNQNVPQTHPYLTHLPINSNLNWIMGNERPLFITAPGLVSPFITWEVATTLNFGVDVEALNNRLSLIFDWYTRTTDQMFGPQESYPNVLGTTPPRPNNASMETKGFELTVGWRDRIGEVGYSARVLLSDNISTITNYRNATGSLGSHYIGKTLGEIWGLTTVGLYATDDAAKAGPDQTRYNTLWTAGDVQYADINGDGKVNTGRNTLDDPGDLSVIGNNYPRYSYGISLGAEWKGFYVDMLWQGVGKRDVWLASNFFWGVTGNINQSTVFREHLDYWRPDNPDAYFPKPYMTGQSAKNRQIQTKYLQDASYVRLKNLQFGYTLPASFTNKFSVSTLRVYFTGENLLTFTNILPVFDPEGTVGAYGEGKLYPLSKVYSLGLNLTLK